jgi:peptidyl-prolyl cis-trans isomerase C
MVRQFLRLTTATAMLVALTACDQASQTDMAGPEGQGPVIATVNGTALYESELREVYDSLPPETRQLPFAFIQDQLTPLIVNRTLMTEAAREAGFADDAEVKKRIATMSDDIMREAWVVAEIEKRQTDERLRAAYDARLAEMTAGDEGGDAPTERHARHILVDTLEQATNLIAQLDAGGDFIALANANSIDTASVDGDLGYFGRGMMVQSFEEAAFALPTGSYSTEPVQSQFGFHIILVEDEREIEPPTFEELRDDLAEAEVRSIYPEIIEELRAGATIEFPEADVEEADLAPLPAE